MRLKKSISGFTLLEILIALFVFAILAAIMSSALRNFLSVQASLADKSTRLRSTQMAFLVLERDLSQAISRTAIDSHGKQNAAFIGEPTNFALSHTGYANPDATEKRSILQRTAYQWHDNTLWRSVWRNIDEAPESKTHERQLLVDISDAKFEYADNKHKFYPNWPGNGEEKQPLPQAVRISLSLKNWGKVTRLFVIPTATAKKND